MWGFRLRGIDLDIEPGSSLQFELISTVMNESDEFLGSHSWPVLFGPTDKNKAAFKNAHLPENRSVRKTETGIITMFGAPWKQAKMVYDVSSRGYDADLKIDNAEFANIIKEKEITDVFLEYENGAFKDLKWILVGSSKAEALAKVMDSCNNVGKYPFVFFLFKNDMATGTLMPNTKVNWFNAGVFTEFADPTVQDDLFYTPCFYLTWLVKEVCTYLGFDAEGDFFTDPEMIEKVIYNTGMMDYATFHNAAGFKIAPARHLPKMKITDLFKKLKSAPLNLAIKFDGTTKKASFTLKKNILSSKKPLNLSKYIDQNSIKCIHNDVTQFKLTTAIDSADELYTLYPYATSYLIGEGKEAKPEEMGFGTLRMNTQVLPAVLARYPIARQVANIYSSIAEDTPAFNDPTTPGIFGKNSFAFRLLNYKGMVMGAIGAYPYATSDKLNPFYGEAYESSCLPEDLIKKYSLDWYSFRLATEKLEAVAAIPETDFAKIDPFELIQITTKTQAMLPCVFSRGSIGSGRELIPAKLTLYPHYNIEGLSAPTVTVVTPGESSGAVPIWVKLEVAEYGASKPGVYTEYKGNFTLKFFRDQAATIPIEVNNLKVKINRHYQGVTQVRDEVFFYIASGTVYPIPELQGVRTYYKRKRFLHKDELEIYSWNLMPEVSSGYNIINTAGVPVR